MDPATAIGVASSVLNIIEFSWHVLHGTREVYMSSSGATIENAHISNVLNDLEDAADALTNGLEGRDRHERAVLRLAGQCQSLSLELGGLLRRLQAKDTSTWESLRTKLRSMLKEKEVASLEKRLGEYRQEIILQIDLMILYAIPVFSRLPFIDAVSVAESRLIPHHAMEHILTASGMANVM